MRDYSPLRELIATRESVHLKAATVTELLDELDALRLAAAPAKMKRNDYPATFEEVWQAYPPCAGSSKRATFKQWSARIKAGVTAETMLAGVRAYAAFIQATGRITKLPETFFGPMEHYATDWTPPEVIKKPESGAWKMNDDAIMAKGRELGVAPRSGEYMWQFKARIEALLDPGNEPKVSVAPSVIPPSAAPPAPRVMVDQPDQRTQKPEGIGALKDLVRKVVLPARAA